MTSIATFETFVGQTIIDALVTAGLSPASPPSTPILYHGREPDDCCPPDDAPPRIVVWWKDMGRPTVGFDSGCPEPAGITICARLYACWPNPPKGIVSDQAHELFDEPATWLARVGWVGLQALVDALGLCDDGRRGQRKIISETLGVKSAAVGQVIPRLPMGGCAGIDWNVRLIPHGEDIIDWMTAPEPDPGP